MGDRVRTEFVGENVSIELERAVPYGLLVNELVSNALKHAFPGNLSGSVRIQVAQEGAQVQFLVADDGTGVPAGFRFHDSHSLGMRLIFALTEQLGGTINYLRTSGTTVEVHFPARADSGDRFRSRG